MTYTTRRERRQAEKLQAKQLRNRRLAAGGASLSIILGATLASSPVAVAAPVSKVTSSSAATTTTHLNMRSGPSAGKSVVKVLSPSATVAPTGKSSGSWVQVTASGRTGWVHSAYLKTGSTPARKATTSSATGSAATKTSLNMRSGPGVGNSVITVLARNASVSLLGQSSGSWVKIKASGRTGWVNGSYLKSRSTSSSTSTARATTTSTSSNASPLQLQLASATSPSSWRTTAAGWARTKADSAGVYYTWGGNGPTGYDCSGFTSGAYAAAGKSLPRTSRAQYTSADSRVSLGNLQTGDLVFWSNNGAASGIYHVAVYIGDGMIAHARNPQMGVKVTDLHYSPSNMMGTGARYN